MRDVEYSVQELQQRRKGHCWKETAGEVHVVGLFVHKVSFQLFFRFLFLLLSHATKYHYHINTDISPVDLCLYHVRVLLSAKILWHKVNVIEYFQSSTLDHFQAVTQDTNSQDYFTFDVRTHLNWPTKIS
jgi:hypothetical protein